MSASGLAKKFYEQAAVKQIEGGFTVTLDGRSVKTPGKLDLLLPGEALARAIAEEWNAQGDHIKPSTMPCMQLACTAIERVANHKETIIDQVSGYGGSDLICYFADTPDDLVLRQRAAWQPLRDWACDTFAIDMKMTSGIVYVEQSVETLAAIRAAVSTLDDYQLSVLCELVQVTGSFVIGLAAFSGRLDAQAAFDASQVDESWQIERWGEDDEARIRRETILRDITAALRFLRLIAP